MIAAVRLAATWLCVLAVPAVGVWLVYLGSTR